MEEFEVYQNAAKKLNILTNTFIRHYLDIEEHGYKFKVNSYKSCNRKIQDLITLVKIIEGKFEELKD